VLTLPATSGTVVTTATSTGISGSAITTGTVGVSVGGTGQTTAAGAFNALNPMTTVGDIIYEGSGPAAARLPIGTSGQLLTVSGGIPAWATVSSTPTTDQVLTATAGATANAVGTYAWLQSFTNGAMRNQNFNTNIAGSSFSMCSFSFTSAQSTASGNSANNNALSGTWKLMGADYANNTNVGASLFLRIS
jgi:hypothetical protein